MADNKDKDILSLIRQIKRERPALRKDPLFGELEGALNAEGEDADMAMADEAMADANLDEAEGDVAGAEAGMESAAAEDEDMEDLPPEEGEEDNYVPGPKKVKKRNPLMERKVSYLG